MYNRLAFYYFVARLTTWNIYTFISGLTRSNDLHKYSRLIKLNLKNIQLKSGACISFHFLKANTSNKPSPQHNAPIAVLCCSQHDGVLSIIKFMPDIVASFMAKIIHFSVIWPHHLFLHVWGVVIMHFREFKMAFFCCFFKAMSFLLSLFTEAQFYAACT